MNLFAEMQSNSRNENPGMKDAERVIWFYWSQGWDEAPWFVKFNYLSWIVLNPEWKAIFLCDKNLSDYSRAFEIVKRNRDKITVTALSDVIRLDLLANRGGAWVDATLLCRTSLDLWLPQKLSPSGVFSFRSGCVDRELASWHIAAKSKNYLVQRWLEMTEWYWGAHRFDHPQPWIVLNELEKVYCVSRDATEGFFNEDTLKLKRVYPYFWVNYLHQRLVRQDSKAAAIWSETPFAGSSVPSQFLEHNPAKSLNEHARKLIAMPDALMFKFNRRSMPDTIPGGSALEALYLPWTSKSLPTLAEVMRN